MPDGRCASDRRDRGRALLQARRRRLRGHRPRRRQERRVRQDGAGRLDDHPAARARALHQGPASATSSARSARPRWPRSSRSSTRSSWILQQYLNNVPYGTVNGRPRSASRRPSQIYFAKHAKEPHARPGRAARRPAAGAVRVQPVQEPGGRARAPQRGAASRWTTNHYISQAAGARRRSRQPLELQPGNALHEAPRALLLRLRAGAADRALRRERATARAG